MENALMTWWMGLGKAPVTPTDEGELKLDICLPSTLAKEAINFFILLAAFLPTESIVNNTEASENGL